MPINNLQSAESVEFYKGKKNANLSDIVGALSEVYDAVKAGSTSQETLDALYLLHQDLLDINTLDTGILNKTDQVANNTNNLYDLLLVNIATRDFTILQVSGNFTMNTLNVGDESPIIDKQLFAGMSFVVKTNVKSSTVSSFSLGVKYSNDGVTWFTTTTTLNCATDLTDKCPVLTQNTPFKYIKLYVANNALAATSLDCIWSVSKI